MKILHTSDWHLGRTLHGIDMHDHQAAFLDHLVALVEERDVDAVLVSGDIYDRSVPSTQTVNVLSRGLASLTAATTVIITPGNHDSAVRLGFAAGLMRDNLRILADVSAVGTPVVLADGDRDVLIYGIPYLDPDAARSAFTVEGQEPPARSHEAVLAAAMTTIRADIAARNRIATTIVMAHAFVAGGQPSESERDISIGGVNVVPSGVFAGADYLALGHLHGAQKVAFAGGVARYSGSPLSYSFSEMNQHKSSVLLEIDADGTCTVDLIPTPVPRRLAEIRGTIQTLLDGTFDDHLDDWLRVYVTDPAYPTAMYARVKEHFPEALAILHEPAGVAAGATAPHVTDAMDPIEVTTAFVEFATNAVPTDAEVAILQSAYDDVRRAARSA